MELRREFLSCSICLDILKDPVTLPCGHNYCRSCIKNHWDREDGLEAACSCPQCRQVFPSIPVLMKNSMLAHVVEEAKKSGLADPHCYAGPEDVACDFCSGRKLKAIKSCLVCLASYCQQHLQPHLKEATFRSHKLQEPSRNLQENICTHHKQLRTMFCRSDNQCICFLCFQDTHQDHHTVPAAAERSHRQKEVEASLEEVKQAVQNKEKDLNLLGWEVEAINHSADEAEGDSEKIFSELIRLIQKGRADVKQQIRTQKEAELSRIRGLREKMEQEISELRRRDAELKKISATEDPIQFLLNYLSQSKLTRRTDPSRPLTQPSRYHQDITAAVLDVRDKLQDVLTRNISLILTEVETLQINSELEPQTREEFLKYSCNLTLDPDTANSYMVLSKSNRRVTVVDKPQLRPHSPYRFDETCQVLSTEALTSRCYWEVDWEGEGVSVAVAYKNIGRVGKGNDCKFGHNDRSWALHTHHKCFWFNNKQTVLLGPARSSTVGVFLDQRAGSLSFFSVSGSMTLLHRVQTSFTQPLHAGLRLYYTFADSAEICNFN